MGQLYRIHFGTSKRSRFYPQALELAALAFRHEVRGEGTDVWHVVSVSDEQLDLMHRLYLLSRKLPRPKFHGVEPISLYLACERPGRNQWFKPPPRVQDGLRLVEKSTGKSGSDLAGHINAIYIDPIDSDMLAVLEKLRSEGCLDGFDYEAMKSIPSTRRLSDDPVPHIKRIRELIAAGDGPSAVEAYYKSLGEKFYGELTNELIYLKRLSRIPLTGRDLLYFKSESSRDAFVRQNLTQYVDCIDATLARCLESGRSLPLNILLEYAPTMEQMVEARKREWHLGAYLRDGEIKRDFSPVTFSAQFDSCPEGRLFDRYPDQIRHCRVENWVEDSNYNGLWITYSPDFCKQKIYSNDLHINSVDAYYPKAWHRRFYGRRDSLFTACVSLNEIEKSTFGTNDVRFTGREHKIEEKVFYEIDLVRHQKITSSEVENPFLELVEELLYESENLLRERHGLPRIGEGWFAEMQMFRLIQKRFPDAQLHARLAWLSPQHLDCYVPSKNVGFEYQGQQHFQPSAFFGGEEGLLRTQQRDKIKAEKCNARGIKLIYWIHNELLTMELLQAKLAGAGIS